ncbi:MAG: ABC transporter substrate-binding protein [Candidatus Rokuibacteriota bacterium]
MQTRGPLVLVLGLVILLTAPRGIAQSPLQPPAPAGPATVRIGALLPLSGASSWYGREMRQGMELAIADVKLALEALDVDPLNPRQATEQFARLAAMRVPAVLTASATPTLAIHPAATAQDILLVHQGVITSRFPSASRILIHIRPSLASRVEALAAHARERGFGRLALLTEGDDFGKAVRTVMSARWQKGGASLVHDESLSLETPDLRSRLRHLARLAPNAVLLGFRGVALGDLARQLREAGYTGPLLALDDDPSAILAAGSALEAASLLTEAFVAEPGSAGERFAQAYRTKYKSDPSLHAAQAYDTVTILAEGIRTARDAGRGTPSGTRLRDTLLARGRFPSLIGGQIAIRDDGVIERPFALFTVERDKPVFVRYLTPGGRAADGSRPRSAAASAAARR